MSRVKIVVCCHQDGIYKESDVYLPLFVGKKLSNLQLNMQGDDTGDNISEKNRSYCELTGLYWAWKNLKDADFIGLCHYRRYFDFNHIGRRGLPVTTISSSDLVSTELAISNKALSWLESGGIILAKEMHLKSSVYLHYCESHYSKDFRVIGDVLKEKFPSKYIAALINATMESNRVSFFNMMIMPKQQLHHYCSWLFALLAEVEKRIDISSYDAEQKRIYGFMAERLLNVYAKAEQLKVMHVPVLRVSDTPLPDEHFPLMKYKLRCLLYDLAMKMTK